MDIEDPFDSAAKKEESLDYHFEKIEAYHCNNSAAEIFQVGQKQPSDYFSKDGPLPNHTNSTLTPSYWALLFHPKAYTLPTIDGLNMFGTTPIAYPVINPGLLAELPRINDKHPGQRDSNGLHKQFICSEKTSLNIRQINYHLFDDIIDRIQKIKVNEPAAPISGPPSTGDTNSGAAMQIF